LTKMEMSVLKDLDKAPDFDEVDKWYMNSTRSFVPCCCCYVDQIINGLNDKLSKSTRMGAAVIRAVEVSSSNQNKELASLDILWFYQKHRLGLEHLTSERILKAIVSCKLKGRFLDSSCQIIQTDFSISPYLSGPTTKCPLFCERLRPYPRS